MTGSIAGIGGLSTKTFEFGDIVQPAWHIKWNTDLQSILQPPMPSIAGAETIATWVPPVWTPPASTVSSTSGSSARSSSSYSTRPIYPTPSYDSPTCEKPGYGTCDDLMNKNPELFMFLIIGLPVIIGVALVGSCFTCCVVSKRRNRERNRIMADQCRERELEMEVGVAGGQVRDSADDRPPMYSQEALVVQPPEYTPPAHATRN